MKLIFGLEFDELVLPDVGNSAGAHVCGRRSLLHLLESHLGLSRHRPDVEVLRIERYRQALATYLQAHPEAFYAKSFEADPFATASTVLNRRDELLMAGWDFKPGAGMPERLRVLSDIENLHSAGRGDQPPLPEGYADRFAAVIEQLQRRSHPLTEIWLNEPLEHLPAAFRRLFQTLRNSGQKPPIQSLWSESVLGQEGSDLAHWQRVVLGQHQGASPKAKAKADGTLLVLRCRRATDAAVFVAKWLQKNPDTSLGCIIPEKNRLLENALVQEGFPSLGMPSSSTARPVLQLLKLAPTFLWDPPDPYKILEFLSLQLKPMHADLAAALANQIANAPGLFSEGWQRLVEDTLQQISDTQSEAAAAEARRQYEFWFQRRRYNQLQSVPREAAIEVFVHIARWAQRTFEWQDEKWNSLTVLREQALKVATLLQALPQERLTRLELERIVRTIYEPAPVVFLPRQVNHLPYVNHPAALSGPVPRLLWWNFVQNEAPHFFPRWYAPEYEWLKRHRIEPDNPAIENARMLWQQRRPVLAATQQLMLVIPDTITGQETEPHPLYADLLAAFENPEALQFDLDHYTGTKAMNHFELPARVPVEQQPLPPPRPFLRVRSLPSLARERESYTSLEKLLYYPYQWFMRYKLQLLPSPILSIAPERQLKGNLAHRLFEELLLQPLHEFDRKRLDSWVEEKYAELVQRQGAVLLLYGKEPERVAFGNQLKRAAWSLVSTIQNDRWQVAGTEVRLEGTFPADGSEDAIPVDGIADVVLERNGEKAIIDLKLSSMTHFVNQIKNNEDLQPVLYACLLYQQENRWPHTAFFIIDKATMVTRSEGTFSSSEIIKSDQDLPTLYQEMIQKMARTYRWRIAQLMEGMLEVRCQETHPAIEQHYSSTEVPMLELLELHTDDAPFDDYQTLIGLVR